jgi:imidazolonepropionase-like amidohydrolase
MKYLAIALLLMTSACDQFKKIDIGKIVNVKGRTIKVKTLKGDTDVLINNAKVYTVAGKTYEQANVLIKNGLISRISTKEIRVTSEVRVIDAKGLHLTPGIIDVHSHMGVYPMPSLDAHADGNEMTNKATPQVNAKDSFWPQDPALWRALEGGVTVIQVLPGSANLVGGESFIAKMNPKTTASEMRFVEAPRGIKMACGENPKRVYGEKGGPSTRMGNAASFRELFQAAKEYDGAASAVLKDKPKDNQKDKSPAKVDFKNQALKRVLSGETMVNLHCYRADDIATMIEISKEYGFKIRSVHHGLEAYKLKNMLAKEDIAVATWADWWGFKAEAYDGIPHNVALLHAAGAKAIVHSDSEVEVRFLNVEAAKAWRSGLELGLKITEEEALSWITKNPAWALGVEKYVGTIETGKHADLVLWDGHPLSIYSKSQMVFINGEVVLDRKNDIRPRSDFELGYREKMFYDGRDFAKVKTVDAINLPSFSRNMFELKKNPSNSFALKNVNLELEKKTAVDILVESGVITKIEKTGAHKSWPTTAVDGKGKLVTAGLIESVSTLGLFEIGAEKSASDRYSSIPMSQVDFKAEDSLNLNSVRIPITRKEGVTTNFSYVFSGSLIQGQGVGFDLSDQGPRSFEGRGPLLSSVGKSLSEQYSSRSQRWKRLRRLARETHKYKSRTLGDFEKTPLLSKEDYEELQIYFEGKKPWIFIANKLQDIKTLLSFIKDVEEKYGFKIDPILMGGAESWLAAKDLKALGVPVLIKPTELVPSNFESLRTREDLAAFLVDQGIDVGFTAGATDFAAVRRMRQEMGYAIKYGLSWSEALKAVTETPAKILKLEGRGTLEPGMVANMVMWSGDLAEPYNTADKVWIKGKAQTLKDRQRMLAEKYL